MGPLVTRRATEDDAAAVASVLHDAFIEFRALYTAGGFDATVVHTPGVLARMREGPMWVAGSGGLIVGTVAAIRQPEGLYIRGMAVVPSARGRGVAGSLLREAERFGRSEGLTRAFLSTTPFLQGAIRLYERAGYSLMTGSGHDLFGTPLVSMEKRLAGLE